MRIRKEICFHYVLSAQDIKTDKSEFLSPIFPDSEFSREDIVFLYGKRWNIETHFRFEKYSLELENVASKTSIRFLQEYYDKNLNI
ncbi:hypothetical protein LEP1GSC133_0332 [Leptospira borgpetersenii serovar Pomona str. 200901868]|uniref:Transposase, IS4-like family protein n=1 Tax=Leptospira borgpetersenii serovar Pomona str. 200901868 TaxID=1192866 RepID=M6VUI8_LEPBO|nr:hypothetical protein LEP1GSC133_0332 [Leptospira borgpetersenii serovar Pomona str. 200901868]